MKAVSLTSGAVLLLILAFAGIAAGGGPPGSISLGVTSEQNSASSASVESVIQSHTTHVTRSRGSTASTVLVVTHRGSQTQAPSYPTIEADDPLLQNPSPFGPGTFWYGGGANISCVYVPDSTPLCVRITGPAAAAAQPAVNPAGIAAAVAARLELTPGELRASPADQGLTGSDSWFWLEPAPMQQELTTSLGGETVTVTATPSVTWQFGDGSSLTGGAGVAYRPGTPPPEAIVHVFETRCLAGDQGRNPYVLRSCGSQGYALRAVVRWAISYTATGPVAASGTLPARTTEASQPYPVSEARGFLVGNGGA